MVSTTTGRAPAADLISSDPGPRSSRRSSPGSARSSGRRAGVDVTDLQNRRHGRRRGHPARARWRRIAPSSHGVRRQSDILDGRFDASARLRPFGDARLRRAHQGDPRPPCERRVADGVAHARPRQARTAQPTSSDAPRPRFRARARDSRGPCLPGATTSATCSCCCARGLTTTTRPRTGSARPAARRAGAMPSRSLPRRACPTAAPPSPGRQNLSHWPVRHPAARCAWDGRVGGACWWGPSARAYRRRPRPRGALVRGRDTFASHFALSRDRARLRGRDRRYGATLHRSGRVGLRRRRAPTWSPLLPRTSAARGDVG